MIRLTRPACPNPRALETDYKHLQNKDALKAASHDKCMYCESKISHVYFGDVEHIKPKSLFPHLEYEWKNLGYVCAKCNNNKSNKFEEQQPFINPYEENPSEFLVSLGPLLCQRQGNEKGEITITEIGLNRTDLIERRMERIDAVRNIIDKMVRTNSKSLRSAIFTQLQEEAKADKEYSMIVSECISRLIRLSIQ